MPNDPFTDRSDEKRCLLWMDIKIEEINSSLVDKGQINFDVFDENSGIDDPEEVVVYIKEISEYIENRQSEIGSKSDWPDLNDEEWEDAWEKLQILAGVKGEEIIDLEWRLESMESLPFGYSDSLDRTFIFSGGTEATHVYNSIPPTIMWPIHKIVQKGKVFYIASAKVCEIDAVCSVPSLPEEMDSAEAGMRILSSKRGSDEWQRRLNGKRITSLRSFIETGENIIANTPMLFIRKNTNSVSIMEKNGQKYLKVVFLNFLQKVPKGGYIDAIHGGIDHRPIWLIDGQHRIRGLSRSATGKDLEVPIIIFPEDFDIQEAAKIFAEINTLQANLTPLHTLFMQHRFHIPSPVAKRNFSPGDWDSGEPDSDVSRANHLIYEAAGYLSSNEDGPLYNRIRILDQNQKSFTVVKADQWVDFGRAWFLKNGPYETSVCDMSQDEINQEIENYFSAIVETCNHSDWEDKKPRWSPNTRGKGLIQTHSHFQVLIKAFPTVWERAVGPEVPSPIPVKSFKKAMDPLKWIDWRDPRLKDTFGGGGEKGRSALRVWIEDAVRNGEQFGLEDVMSDSIKSKAGKGILAPPGKTGLSIRGETQWPSKGNPVTMVASRPTNSLLTSYWGVVDSDGNGRTEDATSLAKPNREEATFVIKYAKWMEDVDSMDVSVSWRNAASPPTGRTTRSLKKPSED